jgi:hypothetical protein
MGSARAWTSVATFRELDPEPFRTAKQRFMAAFTERLKMNRLTAIEWCPCAMEAAASVALRVACSGAAF